MNIYNYFEDSYKFNPEKEALHVDGEGYAYTDLHRMASHLAEVCSHKSEEQFIGIYAHRSMTAFSSVLGILKAGKAYLPLNPKFPHERNKRILELSDVHTIIVGSECVDQFRELLKNITTSLTVIFPENTKEQIGIMGAHNIITKEHLTISLNQIMPVKQNAYAYMLFTSGSTGTPKGVPISHGNVRAYVENVNNILSFSSEDRFSNTFDLTFDLSVHDMFICWSNAAALYSLPEKTLFAPAKYIKQHALTVWFSVPSLALGMQRLRLLKPEAYPMLRTSLFCGEALTVDIATAWQESAPNSAVVNIYGPTEATIGISYYKWQKQADKNPAYNGIVPIGKVFHDQEYLILDENDQAVGDNELGEFYLGGSQVTNTYWKDEAKTEEQFIRSLHPDKVWYKTGDLVKEDQNLIFFVGRKDHQVKIKGYRVELQEIDHLISKQFGAIEVLSIAHAVSALSGTKILTFVAGETKLMVKDILDYCEHNLPSYMIPEDIVIVPDFPHNTNGKVDRKQLLSAYLEK